MQTQRRGKCRDGWMQDRQGESAGQESQEVKGQAWTGNWAEGEMADSLFRSNTLNRWVMLTSDSRKCKHSESTHETFMVEDLSCLFDYPKSGYLTKNAQNPKYHRDKDTCITLWHNVQLSYLVQVSAGTVITSNLHVFNFTVLLFFFNQWENSKNKHQISIFCSYLKCFHCKNHNILISSLDASISPSISVILTILLSHETKFCCTACLCCQVVIYRPY